MEAKLVLVKFDTAHGIARGFNPFYVPGILFPEDGTIVIYGGKPHQRTDFEVVTIISEEFYEVIDDLQTTVTLLPRRIWEAAKCVAKQLDGPEDHRILTEAGKRLLGPAEHKIQDLVATSSDAV